MGIKSNKVVLQAGDKQQAFELRHAERILSMPRNGGWGLPPASEYQYSKENGLIIKRNTGEASKARKKKQHKPGSKA